MPGSPAAVTVAVSDSSPEAPVRLIRRPAASRAGGCRSWRHCLLTGAGTPKAAARRSSRYSPGRHNRSWPTSQTCRCSTTSTPTTHPSTSSSPGSSATRSSPASTTGATSCQPPTSPASTRCPSGSPAARSRCSPRTGTSAAPEPSGHTASPGAILQ